MRHRRSQRPTRQQGRPSDEDAVVVVVDVDPQGSREQAAQVADHLRGLVDGVAHQNSPVGDPARCQGEAWIGQPVGLVDPSTPAHEDVFDHHVELAASPAQIGQGVVLHDLDAELVEVEPAPRCASSSRSTAELPRTGGKGGI